MKNYRSFFWLFAVLLLSLSVVLAQNITKDVVYLKNGSIIKGSIIELIPEKSVKIQTSDGSIFVYAMSEIEKISKETVQSNEPMNLFGGGAQSLPSRFSLFGGVAIPVGDFASETSVEGGAAKMGFTAGAQFVTGGQIGFLINASYSMNPTNITGNIFPYEATIESKSWSSILILAGLKIGTTNATGTNFFFAPLIGLNIASTPEITGKISGSYYLGYPSYTYVPITGTGTVESASSTALAYGATAEVLFGNITIGARYIACKPKYDIKAEVNFSGHNSYASVTGSGKSEMKIEQNTSIMFVYLGFAF